MPSMLLASDARHQRLSRSSHLDCLRPAGWELLGLVLLVVYYLLAEELFGPESHATTNTVGPIWLMGVLALGMARMARMNPDAIWTALFWFRLSNLAYFGFGNLVHVFASASTRLYIETFYQFSDAEVARVNLLVVFCVLAVLSTASLLAQWRGFSGAGPDGVRFERRSRENGALAFGLVFYGIGATIKYLLVLPFALGLAPDVLPGTVAALGDLTLVGLYLLSAWSFERRRSMLPLAGALVLLEMAVGLLTFAKTAVLFAPIMFFLGLLRGGFTLPRVAITAAVVALVYALITPIVGYGRDELTRLHGSHAAPLGLEGRLAIVDSYFTGGGSAASAESDINWQATRLSYVNVVAFVMRRYDAGHPGNSLKHLPAVFIPRFLWPDKPIITEGGAELTLMALGFDTSQTGASIIGEAYWNFGWWGVPILMIPLGLIFSLVSAFALSVLRRGAWIYFPLVLLGMKMGLRIDGLFVADVAGTVVIMLWLYVILAFVDRLTSGRLRRPLST